jgi:ribonuclease-3
MYTALEQALGYRYKDRSLLNLALSHSSYANEVYKDSHKSYERLEFLGDSILGFVTADYLYGIYPNKLEGELTRIRAELVCEKSLAEVAEQIHLGDYLRLGYGEAQGGGRHRKGILCDVVEALIAAAYLDSGFEEAKGIITRLILPKLGEINRIRDYKTELQELVQRKKDQQMTYELVEEIGPDHCKEFLVRVVLNGNEIGRGMGTSKKRAEQAAAGCALVFLKKQV